MTPPPVAPVRPRAPVGLVALVSVLAALLVATLGVAGVVRFAPGPKTLSVETSWPDDDGQRAVRAARACVGHFFDIDRETVDEDIQRLLGCATGTFAEEYESGRDELEKAVRENDVRSTPKIIAAALVGAADHGTATALVAADARVRNTSSPKGRTVHYRVEVQMKLIGGEWKVAELKFVG